MSDQEQGCSKPPQAPKIERKIQFHRLQMVGIPLILLIPILAIAGVFGETSHVVRASSPQLFVAVEYPTRFRYKMIDPIQVAVQNSSAQPLATVEVNFERAYIDRFSNVFIKPDVAYITDAVYVWKLRDLQPQETRVITIEIQAAAYWRHEGTVTAVADNGESVTVSVATFVFP